MIGLILRCVKDSDGEKFEFVQVEPQVLNNVVVPTMDGTKAIYTCCTIENEQSTKQLLKAKYIQYLSAIQVRAIKLMTLANEAE